MAVTRRLFSHDPMFGVTKFWHYDDDTDIATIETQQDIEPLLEVAQDSRNQNAGTRWGDGRHIGFVPQVQLAEWYATGQINDQAALRKWFNASDNRRFRTMPGKV